MTEIINPEQNDGSSPTQEREAFYKVAEEQDTLIARGIKLISQKVLDLLHLCTRLRIEPDDERSFTLLSTKKWRNSITAVYNELQAWELHHVGNE
jgi:hypothetical protein